MVWEDATDDFWGRVHKRPTPRRSLFRTDARSQSQINYFIPINDVACCRSRSRSRRVLKRAPAAPHNSRNSLHAQNASQALRSEQNGTERNSALQKHKTADLVASLGHRIGRRPLDRRLGVKCLDANLVICGRNLSRADEDAPGTQSNGSQAPHPVARRFAGSFADWVARHGQHLSHTRPASDDSVSGSASFDFLPKCGTSEARNPQKRPQ